LFVLVSDCGGSSAFGTLLAVMGQNIRQSATTKPEEFKIVSGGQTGADRAGLDWAIKNGIKLKTARIPFTWTHPRVKVPLMKRRFSSADWGPFGYHPWGHAIQTCIITC
jgi:hypothetical protein